MLGNGVELRRLGGNTKAPEHRRTPRRWREFECPFKSAEREVEHAFKNAERFGVRRCCAAFGLKSLRY
jgi:hypothetical protein